MSEFHPRNVRIQDTRIPTFCNYAFLLHLQMRKQLKVCPPKIAISAVYVPLMKIFPLILAICLQFILISCILDINESKLSKSRLRPRTRS